MNRVWAFSANLGLAARDSHVYKWDAGDVGLFDDLWNSISSTMHLSFAWSFAYAASGPRYEDSFLSLGAPLLCRWEGVGGWG